MTASISYSARRNRYLAFVQKTYPDKINFAKYLFDSEKPHTYHCHLYSLDFDTVSRSFPLSISSKPGILGNRYAMFEKPYEELEVFIKAQSQSSKGLVIFYDQSRSQLDLHVYGGLAEILHADPQVMNDLYEYMRTKRPISYLPPRPSLHYRMKQTQTHGSLQNSRRQQLEVISLSLVGTNIDVFDLSERCRLPGKGLPIYLICVRSDFENVITRANSKSSPRDCISEIVNDELDYVERSFDNVLGNTFNITLDQGDFKTSRHLRFSMTALKTNLDTWNHNSDASSHMPDELKRAAEIMQGMELYETDIRDAYQIFVDSANLLEANKGVQMAEKSIKMSEKSIEMSEMSIRESERVRILTVIAIIFLPISLASSIFGMNVTLINDDTTPFYAFVVTAVALFVGALLIWAASSVLLRYQKLDRAVQKELGPNRRAHPSTLGIGLEEKQRRWVNADRWQLRLRAAMLSWLTRTPPETAFESLTKRKFKGKLYELGS